MPADYIFGYGSLMHEETRMQNGMEGTYLQPAIVHGYIRGWMVKQLEQDKEVVFLGAAPAAWFQVKNAMINGVLYAVTAEQLLITDAFESHGYRRARVPRSCIEMMDSAEPLPEGTIWIYEAAFPVGANPEYCIPSSAYPILLPYLDTCRKGAAEIEEKFPAAKGFMNAFERTTFFGEGRLLVG